jgi:hypothetical protein
MTEYEQETEGQAEPLSYLEECPVPGTDVYGGNISLPSNIV